LIYGNTKSISFSQNVYGQLKERNSEVLEASSPRLHKIGAASSKQEVIA
jgi:hypothetical protein